MAAVKPIEYTEVLKKLKKAADSKKERDEQLKALNKGMNQSADECSFTRRLINSHLATHNYLVCRSTYITLTTPDHRIPPHTYHNNNTATFSDLRGADT